MTVLTDVPAQIRLRPKGSVRVPKNQEQELTCQDNKDGDGNANGIIDIPHNRADSRTTKEKEIQGTFVYRLNKLAQHGRLWGHAEFVEAMHLSKRLDG